MLSLSLHPCCSCILLTHLPHHALTCFSPIQILKFKRNQLYSGEARFLDAEGEQQVAQQASAAALQSVVAAGMSTGGAVAAADAEGAVAAAHADGAAVAGVGAAGAAVPIAAVPIAAVPQVPVPEILAPSPPAGSACNHPVARVPPRPQPSSQLPAAETLPKASEPSAPSADVTIASTGHGNFMGGDVALQGFNPDPSSGNDVISDDEGDGKKEHADGMLTTTFGGEGTPKKKRKLKGHRVRFQTPMTPAKKALLGTQQPGTQPDGALKTNESAMPTPSQAAVLAAARIEQLLASADTQSPRGD